jgi:hypothetical protein
LYAHSNVSAIFGSLLVMVFKRACSTAILLLWKACVDLNWICLLKVSVWEHEKVPLVQVYELNLECLIECFLWRNKFIIAHFFYVQKRKSLWFRPYNFDHCMVQFEHLYRRLTFCFGIMLEDPFLPLVTIPPPN